MPSNTQYNPQSVNDFQKSKLMMNGIGVTETITPGSISNIDLTLTDDHLITGLWIVLSNGNYGDKISIQVVDSQGMFAPAGTVLNQFINGWYLPPTSAMQFDVPYPAKVYAGLTLRIVYTSTGTTAPFIAANYKLHKILM